MQKEINIPFVKSFHVRFMKTGNVLWVDLSSQLQNLSLVSRILKHNFIRPI